MQTMASTLVTAIGLMAGCLVVGAEAFPRAEAAKVCSVNRKVADFPDAEDMSTPESAYATLNRLSASGEQAFWGQLSVPRLAEHMPNQNGKRPVSADAAREWLDAKILEVHLWEKTNAMVIARIPPRGNKSVMDLRWLSWVAGQWLNEGNDVTASLDEARSLVQRRRAYREAVRLRKSRAPVSNPDQHLRPYVEFLHQQATDPQDVLLKLLEKNRLVILGEVHNRPRYWSFNTALIRTPAFARHAGVVYLELPYDHQPLMDEFLASPKFDPAPVIDVLRDLFEFGWLDQPTLDFCQAVWEVNQSLPKEQRQRIVLVDMARPWKKNSKAGRLESL